MPARPIFAAPLLALLALPGHATTINPNACLAVVVAPCYIANLTGPVLITNASQVGFSIGNTVVGLAGQDASGDLATYTDANGALAADPAPAITQSQTALAALLAAGNAPVAPNPGGQSVITNSSTSYNTYVDTPVTQRTDQYSTTIEAVLNGGSTVYDQTFSLPYSDPSVQAAVAAADSILGGDGATYGSPSEIANITSLTGSQLTYQITSQSATGATENSYLVVFGPAKIAVDANQSELFTVLAGQEDINVNTETFYATARNAITTNTYLTSQTYEINGTTSPVSAAPEPESWLLFLVATAVFAAGVFLRRPLRPSANRAGDRSVFHLCRALLPALALCAVPLAHGSSLPPCTANGFYAQLQQSNCTIDQFLGGQSVVSFSYYNDPTFINTPETVNAQQYATTLTALLNGGTTVFQQTFAAPFTDPTVQNAIATADALLGLDGATYGSPLLTANSTALESSVTSFVPTSPTFDFPALFACEPTIGLKQTGTCSGVSVTITADLSGGGRDFWPRDHYGRPRQQRCVADSRRAGGWESSRDLHL